MQRTISTCCLSITLLLSATLFSQSDNLLTPPEPGAEPATRSFVRLYNEKGQRIGGGYLLYGNDTTIMLSKRGTIQNYPVSGVWYIKTRHQRVRDIAIGTGVAAAFLAVTWAASNRQDHNIVIPAIGSAGTAAGGTIKRRTIWIYRDMENWMAARKLFFYR